MLKTLKYYILNIKIMINLIKDSFTSPFTTSFGEKIQSITHGFSSDKAVVYGYDKDSIGDFVSDYQRTKAKRINDRYYQIFDNKLMAERLLSPYVKVPKSHFLLRKGKVTSLIGKEWDHYDMAKLIEFIKEKKSVVLKPVYGGGGTGVQVIHYNVDQKVFSVNTKIQSADEMLASLNKLNNVLLTDFVEQSDYSNHLFAEATNTIRILTMVDPETHEAFIAAAAQRIGTDQTKPTDNFGGGKGGVSVLIDTETGVLSHAVTLNTDGYKEVLTKHPDTGNTIVGVKIPHWDSVKDALLDTIKRNPFLRYVGWDVAITDEGFTVIEINSFSGLAVLQTHQPLKDYDSRIIPFYKHHNIL